MSDLGPFWLSLRVAALATVVIVAAGMPIALLLARARFPGKGLVAGILVLPLVLPPTVLGFYLLQIFGRRAPLGYWLEQHLGVAIVFHWTGAVVASAVAAFPLFLLPGAEPSRRLILPSKTWRGCSGAVNGRYSPLLLSLLPGVGSPPAWCWHLPARSETLAPR